jgi:hypothetical protein
MDNNMECDMSFICNFGNRETLAYKFSVYTKDDADLIALKKRVRENNELSRGRARRMGTMKYSPKILKVRLMARGPRTIWAKQEQRHPRTYDAYLPHEYADYFDVYCSEDSEATEALRVEIEEGMTPAMVKKKRDLQVEIWKIDHDARQAVRLRNAA